MTSELRIWGCTACGSLFIKVVQDNVFRCESCGWEGILQFLHGKNKKFYYLGLIKNKTISAERAAELMGVTVSEMMDMMKEHGLLKLYF